jgi:hypothetical protein
VQLDNNMLKTGQAQVIQQANNDIVALRAAELSYLITFFASFGTQSALVAMFCVTLVSQVPGAPIFIDADKYVK